jgi:sigma-B regulation protein RsbU (phosphoserine phosphatase)
MRRPPAVAIATVSAILVYFVAAGVEILLIERLRPTELELTWISDGILALAFGVAMFLWLHLKWTRRTLSRLEREHIVIETQLSLAAQIQRELLPLVPSDAEGVRWAARLEQAGRIGGDMYDFVRPDARSWLVLVGDVSGKGIPAALVLASIRTMFRMMTGETSDPAQLVERISQRLYGDYGGTPYFTCIIVKVNLDTHELAYANAGHPSGLVIDGADRMSTPLLLESCGPPAGMFSDLKYQTSSVSIPRGAMSVLVTDGITEAFDVLGVSETDRIASVVAQAPRPLAPTRICDALIERTAAALSSGDGDWQDDRTVVAFVVDA